MTRDERDALAWRNYAADWHLQQEVPLACGCDDDTSDAELCAASVAHADARLAARPDPDLDGPPDKWNLDIWTAAWGRNLPLVASPGDYPLPKAPQGMSWLATRLLVRGVKAVELALIRLHKDQMVTMCRARVAPHPDTVAATARRLLQDLTG